MSAPFPHPPARACIAPLDESGDRLCGAEATEERVVAGFACPLCAEHAAELDREDELAERPRSRRPASATVRGGRSCGWLP